ncbi:conserved hypothetical protein [Thermoanaerobacter italicus Ab9]|uniref:Sporulation membrane protein YtrI C-terminal domain-containing protein n=1 Tax=Thermoanaerobacter italicus (strain DSM 9252 / Ab9) TaxID=580331 RepID=D3T3V0_THEIA|nr:hypothetical protein [Thermoanaerobacter italicus]ADD02902.1 conserved hypothetical protein [Thermoanaerobacter italicus Ab9]
MKKYYLHFCFFILGFIIGGSIINAVNGIKIEKLIFEKEAYKMKSIELNEKVSKLNETLKNKPQRVVTDIIVHINNADNKLTMEIEKYVKRKLKGLYGKEIEKIDPTLIKNIFDDRILTIENEKIILKVKFVVINTILEIYLDIDEKIPLEE